MFVKVDDFPIKNRGVFKHQKTLGVANNLDVSHDFETAGVILLMVRKSQQPPGMYKTL